MRRALVLLLLASCAAGCPKSGDLSPAAQKSLVKGLSGVWAADDGSRHYFLEFTSKEVVVQQIVQDGGEPCQVDRYGVIDGVFEYDFTVPSTSRKVHVRIVEVTPTALHATWRDDTDATGTWTLRPWG